MDMDKELEAMKQRIREMEAEAAKLREMEEQVQKEMNMTAEIENREEVDAHYSSTPDELQGHFSSCGPVNRVTILCDKWTGHPKGFAYVEFIDQQSVGNALVLNDTLFKGRIIKVTAKRTNVPGYSRGRGRGRGRGFRARGRGRGYPY